MSASRAMRGRSPAQMISVANTYGISPDASVPIIRGPVAAGNAPPQVFMTGIPITSGPALMAGTFQVSITGGGALGVATWALTYNGSGIASGTTAATVPLGVGGGDIGITLYFKSGNYDTSQTWTWEVGVALAASLDEQIIAAGPTPLDIDFPLALVDSTDVRMHGSNAVTMPSAPWDGQAVSVCDAAGTSILGSTFQVAVVSGQSIQHPNNKALIEAGPFTIAFTGIYRTVTWKYDQAASLWRVFSDTDSAMLQPLAVASGALSPLVRNWIKCSPTAPITISMPTVVEDSMPIRVSDITGGAAAHNITLNANAGAGWTIEVLTLGGPGGSVVMSTNYQSATWAADVTNKVWRLVAVN